MKAAESVDPETGQAAAPPTSDSVEAVVRQQLSKALGGRRGMLEAALPTIIFTVTFLTTKDLKLALVLSVGAALVALVARLIQRSSVQFVVNALIGIGIGALFALRAAKAGGDANDQALAYFLPGLLYNTGYAVVLSLSCLTRWPLVGFMVGSVTGDPTAWRQDPQIVKLCSRLTWVLVAPCVLRVLVQAPVYLAGRSGSMDPDAAVAALGIAKIVMGWPLQLASLALMVWLLARNSTPVADGPGPEPETAPEAGT
ncbi:DUF3159 domain-containing protein [Nocardioides sp. JQ2195]|uniref:DUF3159 domain-containing protein n=1 Tax=Nocardioides sp. JQ2195 TaxID=2592334 RepID=UPI00143E1C04|nr:DUF3159 domain-containing protein [Nocardioides sp. JQ2195]QIX26463.1 DUF3159 domain-containing protein [Nocardioides sp. JQ2195]